MTISRKLPSISRFTTIDFILSCTLAAIGVLVFWGQWQVFFQQDEWSGFGKVIYTQTHGYAALFRVYGLHFTPFTSFLMVGLYNIFGLSHVGFAVFSLALQALNTIFLYILIQVMSGKKGLAFLTAVIFVSLGVSQQAVSWYAASMSFLPSGFFVIVSLLLFEYFLSSGKKLYLAVAVITTLVAAGFRENAIFLMVYFPVRTWLVNKKLFYPVVLYASGATVFYGALRFMPMPVIPADGGQSAALSVTSGGLAQRIMYSLKLFIISIPQLVVPKSIVIGIGRLLFDRSPQAPWSEILAARIFVETAFLKYVYGVLLIVFSGILYIVSHVYRKVHMFVPTISSWIAFILLSFLPFFLLPEGQVIESRHFYISGIGWSALLAYLIVVFWKHAGRYSKIAISMFAIIYLGMNVSVIQADIRRQVQISSVRLSFIQQLKSALPMKLPQKTVFYMPKDLPFQSGVGHMLMVILHGRQVFDEQLNQKFLWDQGSQGYAYMGTTGYGYFTDVALLVDTYCKEKLSPENILSFNWDEPKMKLTDTSERTRASLSCETSSPLESKLWPVKDVLL